MGFVAFLIYDNYVVGVVTKCELIIMSSTANNLQCCIKEEYQHYIIACHASRIKYVTLLNKDTDEIAFHWMGPPKGCLKPLSHSAEKEAFIYKNAKVVSNNLI